MTSEGSPAAALPARLLAETAAMLRFFSRLPVPRLGPADDPAAVPDFTRAVRMLPLAAIVIAAPATVALGAAALAGLPPLAAAGLALAVLVVTTGGLHEDGLADTADGFGGGATRERKLEIMRDSRIGAHGAVALTLALLVRASLIAACLATGPAAAAGALLAAAAVSRTAAMLPLVLLPPARADGLGRLVRQPQAAALAGSLAFAAGLALLLCAAGAGPLRTLSGLLLAALAAAAITAVARRQIGGQTGDVVGAAQQLAELAFLCAIAAPP